MAIRLVARKSWADTSPQKNDLVLMHRQQSICVLPKLESKHLVFSLEPDANYSSTGHITLGSLGCVTQLNVQQFVYYFMRPTCLQIKSFVM